MDVSIIIVNYNTKELLFNCLNSILQNTKDLSFEIIVSDNSSTDGSLEMLAQYFPSVIVIANKKNLGFGAANNKGLSKAKGKYIFYLNSDTLLLNNAIKFFFDYWENNDDLNIGALGSNLLDKDLNIIHSAGEFPTPVHELKLISRDVYRSYRTTIRFVTKLYIIKRIFFPSKTKTETIPCKQAFPYYGEVQYITGADLFVKNNAAAKFDERYTLYYEDTDLCMNLHLHEKKLLLISGPKIIHLKGKSNKLTNSLDRYKSFSRIQTYLSSLIYQKKYHFPPTYFYLCKFMVLVIFLNPFFLKKTYIFIKKLLLI